jgi:hypothetical protein
MAIDIDRDAGCLVQELIVPPESGQFFDPTFARVLVQSVVAIPIELMLLRPKR